MEVKEMATGRMVSESIWKIGSDVNLAIWDGWEDDTIQDMAELLERAPTDEILSLVWRDGLRMRYYLQYGGMVWSNLTSLNLSR